MFAELATGSLDAKSLRRRLGLHGRSARDFFDALVAQRLLHRDEGGRYGNSEEAAKFLDPASRSCIGGLIEMMNARLYGFWGSLTEGLRSGEPQNEMKSGGDLFAMLATDPPRFENFLRAMTGLSRPVAESLARAFVAQHGLSDRVNFIPGDILIDQLPSADVLIMGHMLHGWDLPMKMKLLEKAYSAVPPGGSLIVYEMLIDDERRTHLPGLLMSLNMLIETRGGFDFTGADCIGWMREVGFSGARTVRLTGPNSAVIGTK